MRKYRASGLAWEVGAWSLALVASLAVGTLLSASQVTDPFLYTDIAFIKDVAGQPNMVIPQSGPFASLGLVPGREILMAQLVNLMGVSPEALQYLPIGSWALASATYYAGRVLSKSRLIGLLLSIYSTANLSHATALYSVFGYALAVPLFIAAVLLTKQLARRRSGTDILLVAVLFLGMHLIHYTIATWMLLFLFAANVVLLLPRLIPRLSPSAGQAVPYLFLASTALFLAFNETVFRSFLPLVSPATMASAFERFLSFLSVAPDPTDEFAFVRGAQPNLVSTITLAIILVGAVAVLVANLRSVLRRRVGPDPVTWGVAFLGVVDCLIYSLRGSISTKAFSILFPLFMATAGARRHSRPLVVAFMAVLAVSSGVKLVVFNDAGYVIGGQRAAGRVESVRQGAAWLNRTEPNTPIVMLADLSLHGRALVNAAGSDRLPRVSAFTRDTYASVVGRSTSPLPVDVTVVAIDASSTEPVTGFVFTILRPLGEFIPDVRRNPSLSVVYDDATIVLAVPAR